MYSYISGMLLYNLLCCGCWVQGAPFNIKDFKVLLDAQVYEDLEGRWVDLFNRMKWDIVKSVLKSVAGLQGRKFKVPLLIPPPPPALLTPAPLLTRPPTFPLKTHPSAPMEPSVFHWHCSLWVSL